MRIGTENDYLLIDKIDPDDPDSPYKMEARITENRISFFGGNDAVMFSISDTLKSDFKKFLNWQCNDLKITMTEGCRLALNRDPGGGITVRYRIGYCNLGEDTGLDGVVQVHGEFSRDFLCKLKSMILF